MPHIDFFGFITPQGDPSGILTTRGKIACILSVLFAILLLALPPIVVGPYWWKTASDGAFLLFGMILPLCAMLFAFFSCSLALLWAFGKIARRWC